MKNDGGFELAMRMVAFLSAEWLDTWALYQCKRNEKRKCLIKRSEKMKEKKPF